MDLPANSSAAIALTGFLLPTFAPDSFRGALIWMREWGIWNGHSEGIGKQIVEQMRLAEGEERVLIEAPGMLFDSHEVIKMYSYLALSMLFGWGAFVVPLHQDYLVFVSHDEVVYVISKTKRAHKEALERLKDWNPKEDTSYLLHLKDESE